MESTECRKLSLLLLVLTSNILLCEATQSNVCTDLSNLKNVRSGTFPGFTFKNMTTGGLMLCANECLKRNRCQSFNFNMGQGQCELNHFIASDNDIQSKPDVVYSDMIHFPTAVAQACASHNCSLNEICISEDNGDYICEPEFPSSCAEIQRCAPGSGDGEYWIYLVNFDMVKARMYCHNMDTNNPLEYVTLRTPNYGNYPLLRNQYCDGESEGLSGSCANSGGQVWFYKIRVKPKNLEVITDDHTFANYTHAKLPYGVAQDCYSRHENNTQASCGPKGTFTINLKRTGFSVSSQVTWIIDDSWKAWMNVDRSADGLEVNLNCGGFPGKCIPDGPLLLIPTSTEDTDLVAGEVHCTV